jgi:sugar-specific transcriptional regulator TrmB
MEFESLKQLGLNENEIQIYINLLQLGPTKATDLAKKIGMYRPYVYDNLNKLMTKGLVSNVIIEGKMNFKAVGPEALKERMAERVEEFEKLFEKLGKMRAQEEEKVYVELLRGKNSVRMMFRRILDNLKKTGVKEHLGMGIDDKLFMENEPFFGKWFIKQLERNGIREKMITYEGATEFTGSKITEYRFIPREYFNPTGTLIDGDMVCIRFWTDPKCVIIIKSRELADSYKKQFNLMWDFGKTVKQMRSEKRLRAARLAALPKASS